MSKRILSDCARLEEAYENCMRALGHHIPMPRGGRRENAGRKPKLPDGVKQWNIQVTDEEKAKLKAFLDQLRNPSK